MVAEVIYMLRADVNNGVLVRLTDFLKLPKVIEAGITLKDTKKFITPAPLHMVANVNSKSSPVRMIIAPHRPHMTTKQSINDSLQSGYQAFRRQSSGSD